jgi:hypothetical protein
VEQSQKQQIITITTYYIMTFIILKVNRNHDMFRSDQTIIQWTEINTKGYKIALILPYWYQYICQPIYIIIFFNKKYCVKQ